MDTKADVLPMAWVEAVREAAARCRAVPADIPGLWFAPGYPELTTGQLLQIAALAKAAQPGEGR